MLYSRARRRLFSAIASASFAVPLLAAIAPTPSQADDWNGGYAGVSIGARSMDAGWETTQVFNPSVVPDPTGFLSDPTTSFNSTDIRGVIFAGYNMRINSMFVVGLEGDFGYANNTDKFDSIPGLFSQADGAVSSTEVEATWDGSIRLRGGALVSDNLMVYGTAGVAFLNLEETTTCFADDTNCNVATGTRSFSKSDTLVGWTIGAGMEALLGDNWLVRAEYRYSDYGDYSFTAITPDNDMFGADARIDTKTHAFSVGLAYKFPSGD